jgi:hypothetical protein
MTTQATGTYEVKSWDENPYDEGDDVGKLTRAQVVFTYQGDIEGEGAVEYLMAYPDADAAHYIEQQRVVGRLGKRRGSFVLHGSGTFETATNTASGTWDVVPNSGTGELRGLRGHGSYTATHEPPATFTFDYSFDDAAANKGDG